MTLAAEEELQRGENEETHNVKGKEGHCASRIEKKTPENQPLSRGCRSTGDPQTNSGEDLDQTTDRELHSQTTGKESRAEHARQTETSENPDAAERARTDTAANPQHDDPLLGISQAYPLFPLPSDDLSFSLTSCSPEAAPENPSGFTTDSKSPSPGESNTSGQYPFSAGDAVLSTPVSLLSPLINRVSPAFSPSTPSPETAASSILPPRNSGDFRSVISSPVHSPPASPVSYVSIASCSRDFPAALTPSCFTAGVPRGEKDGRRLVVHGLHLTSPRCLDGAQRVEANCAAQASGGTKKSEVCMRKDCADQRNCENEGRKETVRKRGKGLAWGSKAESAAGVHRDRTREKEMHDENLEGRETLGGEVENQRDDEDSTSGPQGEDDGRGTQQARPTCSTCNGQTNAPQLNQKSPRRLFSRWTQHKERKTKARRTGAKARWSFFPPSRKKKHGGSRGSRHNRRLTAGLADESRQESEGENWGSDEERKLEDRRHSTASNDSSRLRDCLRACSTADLLAAGEAGTLTVTREPSDEEEEEVEDENGEDDEETIGSKRREFESRKRWKPRMLALLLMIQMTLNIDNGVVPAVLADLGREFHATASEQGLVGALPHIGMLVFCPFCARCLEVVGPQRLLLVSLLLNAAAVVFFAVSSSCFSLFLSRFLIGFSQTAFVVYAPVWVDKFAPHKLLTVWMGLTHSAVVVGVVVGYLFAGFLRQSKHNWRGALFLQVVLLLSLILVLAFSDAAHVDVWADPESSAATTSRSRVTSVLPLQEGEEETEEEEEEEGEETGEEEGEETGQEYREERELKDEAEDVEARQEVRRTLQQKEERTPDLWGKAELHGEAATGALEVYEAIRGRSVEVSESRRDEKEDSDVPHAVVVEKRDGDDEAWKKGEEDGSESERKAEIRLSGRRETRLFENQMMSALPPSPPFSSPRLSCLVRRTSDPPRGALHAESSVHSSHGKLTSFCALSSAAFVVAPVSSSSQPTSLRPSSSQSRLPPQCPLAVYSAASFCSSSASRVVSLTETDTPSCSAALSASSDGSSSSSSSSSPSSALPPNAASSSFSWKASSSLCPAEFFLAAPRSLSLHRLPPSAFPLSCSASPSNAALFSPFLSCFSPSASRECMRLPDKTPRGSQTVPPGSKAGDFLKNEWFSFSEKDTPPEAPEHCECPTAPHLSFSAADCSVVSSFSWVATRFASCWSSRAPLTLEPHRWAGGEESLNGTTSDLGNEQQTSSPRSLANAVVSRSEEAEIMASDRNGNGRSAALTQESAVRKGEAGRGASVEKRTQGRRQAPREVEARLEKTETLRGTASQTREKQVSSTQSSFSRSASLPFGTWRRRLEGRARPPRFASCGENGRAEERQRTMKKRRERDAILAAIAHAHYSEGRPDEAERTCRGEGLRGRSAEARSSEKPEEQRARAQATEAGSVDRDKARKGRRRRGEALERGGKEEEKRVRKAEMFCSKAGDSETIPARSEEVKERRKQVKERLPDLQSAAVKNDREGPLNSSQDTRRQLSRSVNRVRGERDSERRATLPCSIRKPAHAPLLRGSTSASASVSSAPVSVSVASTGTRKEAKGRLHALRPAAKSLPRAHIVFIRPVSGQPGTSQEENEKTDGRDAVDRPETPESSCSALHALQSACKRRKRHDTRCVVAVHTTPSSHTELVFNAFLRGTKLLLFTPPIGLVLSSSPAVPQSGRQEANRSGSRKRARESTQDCGGREEDAGDDTRGTGTAERPRRRTQRTRQEHMPAAREDEAKLGGKGTKEAGEKQREEDPEEGGQRQPQKGGAGERTRATVGDRGTQKRTARAEESGRVRPSPGRLASGYLNQTTSDCHESSGRAETRNWEGATEGETGRDKREKETRRRRVGRGFIEVGRGCRVGDVGSVETDVFGESEGRQIPRLKQMRGFPSWCYSLLRLPSERPADPACSLCRRRGDGKDCRRLAVVKRATETSSRNGGRESKRGNESETERDDSDDERSGLAHTFVPAPRLAIGPFFPPQSFARAAELRQGHSHAQQLHSEAAPAFSEAAAPPCSPTRLPKTPSAEGREEPTMLFEGPRQLHSLHLVDLSCQTSHLSFSASGVRHVFPRLPASPSAAATKAEAAVSSHVSSPCSSSQSSSPRVASSSSPVSHSSSRGWPPSTSSSGGSVNAFCGASRVAAGARDGVRQDRKRVDDEAERGQEDWEAHAKTQRTGEGAKGQEGEEERLSIPGLCPAHTPLLAAVHEQAAVANAPYFSAPVWPEESPEAEREKVKKRRWATGIEQAKVRKTENNEDENRTEDNAGTSGGRSRTHTLAVMSLRRRPLAEDKSKRKAEAGATGKGKLAEEEEATLPERNREERREKRDDGDGQIRCGSPCKRLSEKACRDEREEDEAQSEQPKGRDRRAPEIEDIEEDNPQADNSLQEEFFVHTVSVDLPALRVLDGGAKTREQEAGREHSKDGRGGERERAYRSGGDRTKTVVVTSHLENRTDVIFIVRKEATNQNLEVQSPSGVAVVGVELLATAGDDAECKPASHEDDDSGTRDEEARKEEGAVDAGVKGDASTESARGLQERRKHDSANGGKILGLEWKVKDSPTGQEAIEATRPCEEVGDNRRQEAYSGHGAEDDTGDVKQAHKHNLWSLKQWRKKRGVSREGREPRRQTHAERPDEKDKRPKTHLETKDADEGEQEKTRDNTVAKEEDEASTLCSSREEDDEDSRIAGTWKKRTLGRLLTNPLYVCLTLALSSLFFEVTAIQFWATRYFDEELHADTATVLVSFSVTAATAPAVGILVGAVLMDWLGGYRETPEKRRRALFCLLGLSLTCVLLGVCAAYCSLSFWPSLASIWFILFFGGGILPIASGLLLATVDEELRTKASGAATLFYTLLGYTAGTFLPGVISDSIGTKGGMQMILLWSLSGFAFLLLATAFASRILNTKGAEGGDEVEAGEEAEKSRESLETPGRPRHERRARRETEDV
ncbi:UNVERIFIED_CONTAM: transporter, major facilitator family protein [Hammondia hammondi]|eukprot:XP_008882215.1 transporter, major facilitator family protein [Hammondia hammondi]